jgi:hypothetical protein
MPVDTRIDGTPAEIQDCAGWLRSRLATGVDRCVTDLQQTRQDAATGWLGRAGPAFQERMGTGARKADDLRADIEVTANSIDAYADDLRLAQAGMERARRIASDAGLELAGFTILEPGPAPTVPDLPAGSAGQSAPPAAVRAYDEGMVALDAHYRRVEAYHAAAAEARRSDDIIDAAKAVLKNAYNDLQSKALLHVADFVNTGVGGALLATHKSILLRHSDALMGESRLAVDRYLKAPGGSPEAMRLNNEAFQKYLDADEYKRRATSVGRRVGSKLPIIGVGITAAGIGYDIHQGKPVGKAVISGVGGLVAATIVGATIGSAIPVPVAGTLAGAVFGLGAGVVTSGALDVMYDRLPAGVRDGIEDGIEEVGSAIGNVGEAVGDGAKKVWNSIF